MNSERTNECIKKRNMYLVLSWVLCFGTAILLFIYGFATKWTGGGGEVAEHIRALLVTGILSILPLAIISLLVKDKIKPTVRMINVIFAAYFVGNWFMFIVGAAMLFDTYYLTVKIKSYKTSIIANKELDKRGIK